MKREWKTLSIKEVYRNKWIKVFEDEVIMPGGMRGIYGYLTKPNAIFVIAENEEKQVYFLKEYRYVLKKEINQLPAGVMENDDFVSEAKRELFEETGITAKSIEYLSEFYIAPGHETPKVIVTIATKLDVSSSKLDKQEGDESILEIFKLSREEIKKYLLEGKIECGISIAALNLYLLNTEKFDKRPC